MRSPAHCISPWLTLRGPPDIAPSCKALCSAMLLRGHAEFALRTRSDALTRHTRTPAVAAALEHMARQHLTRQASLPRSAAEPPPPPFPSRELQREFSRSVSFGSAAVLASSTGPRASAADLRRASSSVAASPTAAAQPALNVARDTAPAARLPAAPAAAPAARSATPPASSEPKQKKQSEYRDMDEESLARAVEAQLALQAARPQGVSRLTMAQQQGRPKSADPLASKGGDSSRPRSS